MKKLLLTLELNGRVLHEIRTDSFKDPVEIGRSPDCAWSVAGVDPSMSHRHAELFLKRGSVWIRDLESRNGITKAGNRVRTCRIRAGDKLHLGSCTLAAEAVVERNRDDLLPFHRLEQLNGPNAGRVLELTGPDDVTIGSDPASSLLCLDPLVSRQHAALSIKADGSVWVRDLGSRNGTTVNGVALKKDKERMLRDGDVLSVSYVEFRFTDKDVSHPRAHLLRKLGVASATVALALVGYYAYASIRPSARMLIRRAADLASSERFEEARELLRESVGARGAEAYAGRRADLLQRIDAWDETAGAWTGIRAALSARNWDGAQELSVRLADWNWNATTAPREGVRADRALDLLRALRAAQRTLADGGGEDALAAAGSALANARTAFLAPDCTPPGGLPWGVLLLEDAGLVAPELVRTAAGLGLIEKTLASIQAGTAGEEPASARKALAALDAILAEDESLAAAANGAPFRHSPAVSARIADVRAPVRSLVRSEEAFMQNVRFLAAGKFADAEESLPLPSTALAGLHRAFHEYANALKERNEKLCGPVRTGLRAQSESLSRIGFEPGSGRRPKALEALLSPTVAERTLQFVPNPALPPARYGSEEAVRGCPYDAYFGIFDMAEFLEALSPDESPDPAVSEYGSASEAWLSAVESARSACLVLRAARNYGIRTTGDVGALVRLVASVRVPGGENEIRRMLDGVGVLLDEVETWRTETFPSLCDRTGSDRAKLLAGAVRLLFAEKPDRAESDELAKTYRAFKRGLPSWDGTGTTARDLFEAALPGMAVHKKAWEFLHKEASEP